MEYKNRELIKNADTPLQRKYNGILRTFKNKDIIAEFNDCYGTTLEIIYILDTNTNDEVIVLHDTYEDRKHYVNNPKAFSYWTNPKTKKKAILNINTFWLI